MSGSGASNLGYGSITPNSNINPAFVNSGNSNYAGNFGSNEIPSSAHSMRGASWNVDAAKGIIGGGKRKNITKMYRKMAKRQTRRKRRSTYKRRRVMRRSRRMRMRGGGPYVQYGSNSPMTDTYSLGGKLSANLSAMASPPPYTKVNANCPSGPGGDYNHYTQGTKWSTQIHP